MPFSDLSSNFLVGGGLIIFGFGFYLAGILSGGRRPVGQFNSLISKKVAFSGRPTVKSSFSLKNKKTLKIECLMFTVFLFFKEKELFTGKGCVEMDIPWQLCRTIDPLLSQRFPLASAKAQPRDGFLLFLASCVASILKNFCC